jgi:hypothetical protein
VGFEIIQSGSFDRTDKFLSRMTRGDIFKQLDTYGRRGVAALAAATPTDTGISAASWDYIIERHGLSFQILWINRHFDPAGTPIVIMLQYGHGTGTGGYVQGRDFINPAMRPILDQAVADLWREVTSS